MLYRILLFLVGLAFATMGIMFTVIFISYLEPNYTFYEFYHFVIRRFETLLVPIGLILMMIACFAKFKIFKKTLI